MVPFLNAVLVAELTILLRWLVHPQLENHKLAVAVGNAHTKISASILGIHGSSNWLGLCNARANNQGITSAELRQ